MEPPSTLIVLSRFTVNNLFRRRLLAFTLSAALILTGCAGTGGFSGGGPEPGPAALTLRHPIEIPADRARAVFQGGRQLLAQSYYDPYCELVTATVSEQPQTLAADRFVVVSTSNRLLKDPISEIPPFVLTGVSCSDPLYEESRWQLRSDRQPGVLYLRCLVPYFHCRLGPPADAAQVREILGPYFRVE